MSQIDLVGLRESLKKNNEALKEIFNTCNAYCTKTLTRYHHCDKGDANDLIIDAILILREKVLEGKVDYLTDIRHYLLGICVNLHKKRLQKSSNQQKASKDYIEEEMWTISTEEEIVNRESRNFRESYAMSSFKELTNACQEILILYYVDRYAMGEIADKMLLASADVAKVKKMRCLKKWKELFKLKGNG